MRGEFLDLDGARLYYYAAGSRGAGEPIVLIHGFPTSGHLWSAVVPLLPAGYRVVVLDLLGYGRSDPPRRGLDLRSHADRVVGVLDRLRIDVACLVGHDIGGGIAQSVAVRYPQRVSRLCLIDSVALDAWPARGVKLARALLPLTRHLPPSWIISVVRRGLLRGYVDHERGAHDIDIYLRPFLGANGRDALMAHLSALDSGDTHSLAPRLQDIASPTAVLWGAHDPFLPASVGRKLHEAIPRSTFDVITNSRHFVPQEAAHEVAARIGKLLQTA